MRIEIVEEQAPDWDAYASVPIEFESRSLLDAAPGADGAFTLRERLLPAPISKNYDAIAGERPTRWAARFDVSRWGVLVARRNGVRIGGAVVVAQSAGVDLLEGRDDLAVLWDLRVHPADRGRGVGTALFRAAERWARDRGCAEVKVETQNINVPACRFYRRQGCELIAVVPGAYPAFPSEVQFLWYKRLDV